MSLVHLHLSLLFYVDIFTISFILLFFILYFMIFYDSPPPFAFIFKWTFIFWFQFLNINETDFIYFASIL